LQPSFLFLIFVLLSKKQAMRRKRNSRKTALPTLAIHISNSPQWEGLGEALHPMIFEEKISASLIFSIVIFGFAAWQMLKK
jgi:hypothetical protein